MTTLDRMRKIAADHLGFDVGDVSEASSFIDDLNADSLDGVEIMMLAEQEFGVEINDDEWERVLTVGDATNYVDRLIRDRK